MSLPAHDRTTPASPLTLAEAVARARWPRNRATAKLDSHREELLRLAQAGESVGSLVGGLRQFGIDIGHETLRLWLNRELGRRPAKRRRRLKTARGSQSGAIATPMNPVALLTDVTSVAPAERAAGSPASPVATTALRPRPTHGGANDPVPEGTGFIRPGEAPLEAWHRRQAERDAHEAATKTAGPAPRSPRIARDDL
ncbi:MAG: hypothetical protein ACOZE5_08380 [Verrucomicrobiota bacterium]